MKNKIIVSGKRKTSIARAIISEGEGKIAINRKDYRTLQQLDRLKIEEPLRIAQSVLGETNFNIEVKMKGGGEKSQIDAARLAIAKVIVAFTKSTKLRQAYLDYDKNLLVADTRRKEAYKPDDSKARRKRQSSKR